MPTKKKKNENFEEKIDNLEQIIEDMSENVNLERSIELFENGMKLIKDCQDVLYNAKIKINKIVKENGSYQEIPFKEIENKEN